MNNIAAQGHLSHLSIAEIHIQDGFNPRKFIDDAKFKELVSSIKQNGIIQPIVVRPTHDAQFGGYWVVAGERRYKAAVELGLESIPALRKELNDHEAKLIATVENTQRDDMSPAEESQAARDVLMGCHNDRKEAIKLLGWSHHKFEARLLLLHADQAVQDALTERHIKLGHAELLSQLPKDFQVATLAKILESGYSVADLKSRLAVFSLDLSKACFNPSDCNGCPHNSTLQSSLFDDHISAGKCANRECFEQKTENAMLDKKAALSEQYAVVYLDTERTPDSYIVACQSGATGVGRTQFEQGCKQCAHFGALLSIAPDSLGKISEDCCFNMDCHKGKVAAYQASLATANTNTVNQKSTSAPDSSPKSGDQQQQAKSKQKTTATNPACGSENDSASVAALPGRVVEKIEAFYRELAAKSVNDNRLAVLCLNTYAVYRLVRGSLPNEHLPKSLQESGRFGLDFDNFVQAFSEIGFEETLIFNRNLLSHLLGIHENTTPILNKTWAKGAAATLSVMETDLSQHFRLDKEFLSSFTKSGIEAVLRETVNGSGLAFVEHYEKHGDKKTLAGLMKKKNSEILDEVFGCGYDFSGFVPRCISAFMGKDKNQAVASIQQGQSPVEVSAGETEHLSKPELPEPQNEDQSILDTVMANVSFLQHQVNENASSGYSDDEWPDDDEPIHSNDYTKDPEIEDEYV